MIQVLITIKEAGGVVVIECGAKHDDSTPIENAASSFLQTAFKESIPKMLEKFNEPHSHPHQDN